MVSSYLIEIRVHHESSFSSAHRELFLIANSTPFQSSEWLIAWSSIFSKRPLKFIEFWSDSQLVGLWVGDIHRGRARTAGQGPSDYLRPICLPGFETTVTSCLLEEFAQLRLRFDLQQWPSIFSSLDGAWEQSICPRVALPTTFDEYVSSLSKSLRQDIRKTHANPNLEVKRNSPSFLDDLFDLHKKRWHSKRMPGAFGARAQAFQRAFFALNPDCLRTYLLLKEGLPIGALYALVGHDTTYYYQSGFDPEFKRESPGTLLISTAISDAIEAGHSWFDFCRGDERYKARWGATVKPVNQRFVNSPIKPLVKKLHEVEVAVHRKFEI